ncbi:MAG: ATP-binding cassette domain-containing protein [Mycoplasmatota bacterium]
MEILNVTNLRKTYYTNQEEIKAIENVSFSLNDGEFLSIIGPSGCGKSTILSILSKLEEKTDGNFDLKDNYKVGYMLQSDCLLEFKTIFDNCLVGLELQKKKNLTNIKYVEKLLRDYGLDEFKNSYPQNLSGGMRQRVV